MAGNVMAVGKTLTVYLAADLKKFNAGMTQAQGGLKGLAGSLKNMLGPALIGAGIAAGALAVKLASDGVKAALEDEEAVRRLSTTLDNLGLAHDQPQIEKFIYGLERSLGVADTELRPAYDRLVRALGDTGKAQDALSLALDVSAGSGKSLEAVTDAMGKAYEGNIAGLSRLGAGIDAATIKTGDMQVITQVLSDTFSGQATASADTLQGRMRVLKTATDNLAESFGKGLLTGLTDATEGTDDMVKSMEELEPALESVGAALAVGGTAAAGFAGKAVGAATSITGFIRGLQNSQNPMIRTLALFNPLGAASFVLGDGLDAAAKSTDDLTNAQKVSAQGIPYYLGGFRDIIAAANGVTGALTLLQTQTKKATYGVLTLAERQAAYEKILEGTEDTIQTYGGSTASATVEVEKLTKFQKYLEKSNEDVGKAIESTDKLLSIQEQSFKDATAAVANYTLAMQGNLLSGIDLGSAFTDQFDEEGNKTGVALVDAFNAQIAEAEWFGNVLEGLQNSQVDQRLIDYMAGLGPEVGGALGQEMLGDKGLLGTINEKFVNIQDKTRELALGLVPEFMHTGVESAAAMVVSLAKQLDYERQTLKKLGKAMAKPVGAAFKTQLASDVAAAVRNVEAASTAARAERVATAEAAQQLITDQQVARAIANVIRNSDARSGAVVTPVLA
jgi:hypothetical protein